MNLFKYLIIIILFFSFKFEAVSQVLISNSSDTPHESAMLEIRSTTQGLLIPRTSSMQRNSISDPQAGLLVFDTDKNSFYIYGSSTWVDLSEPANMWERKDTMVYLSQTNYNLGIGTNNPTRKLVIQADNDNDTLLEVLNKDGYPLMVITPKLTKFNFIEDSKGIAGGFAVGRFSAAKKEKALKDTALFLVTPDSTRVYTAGVSGGFAVGRFSSAKGKSPYSLKYFYTNMDSTRVYSNDDGKGIAGGFAVGRFSSAKADPEKYAYFTGTNAFIGASAGSNNTTGINNIFIGADAGLNNADGNNNIFIGNQSGTNALLTSSTGNIFIGNNSGSFETGNNKLYISNGLADENNALIYGDFSAENEAVYLNGALRFNKGSTNTITMPTSRGSSDYVLRSDGTGSTNWVNVNSLVTFPETYEPPIIYINREGDFVFKDEDNIGTFIERTNAGEIIKERLPSISTSGDNYNRTITIKNDQSKDDLNVFPYDENDVIEGGYTNDKPLLMKPGETYTLQAGGKELGQNIWFIVDYTNGNLEKNILKTVTSDYDFDNDPSGEGPRVYTLIVNSPEVSNVILPDAASYPNRIIVVKSNVQEGGKALIYPPSGNTIDGAPDPVPSSGSLQFNESFTFQSDGTGNWYVINRYMP